MKPLDAYNKVNTSTLSGRELEAHVLTKAAMALKEVKDNWDTPQRDQLLEVAVRYNQRVWSLFQGEILSENSQLPRELKENLINLSNFIDIRLLEIMAKPQKDKLDIVININLNIAAGLKGAV